VIGFNAGSSKFWKAVNEKYGFQKNNRQLKNYELLFHFIQTIADALNYRIYITLQ